MGRTVPTGGRVEVDGPEQTVWMGEVRAAMGNRDGKVGAENAGRMAVRAKTAPMENEAKTPRRPENSGSLHSS